MRNINKNNNRELKSDFSRPLFSPHRVYAVAICIICNVSVWWLAQWLRSYATRDCYCLFFSVTLFGEITSWLIWGRHDHYFNLLVLVAWECLFPNLLYLLATLWMLFLCIVHCSITPSLFIRDACQLSSDVSFTIHNRTYNVYIYIDISARGKSGTHSHCIIRSISCHDSPRDRIIDNNPEGRYYMCLILLRNISNGFVVETFKIFIHWKSFYITNIRRYVLLMINANYCLYYR